MNIFRNSLISKSSLLKKVVNNGYMKFPEIIYLDKKIEINIIIAKTIILLLKIFFISLNKLIFKLLIFKELLKSNNKSITMGKTKIRAEILILMHEIIHDKINVLE